MRFLRIFGTLIVLLLLTIVYSSCKKEIISKDTALKLSFSEDTVFFDTVFTTVGSTNEWLVIRNPNKNAVQVSKIELAGGESSNFRINIDGVPTDVEEDIVIRGGDSIFIFVEVTVDPIGENTPMVIEDSIAFLTNGNLQHVKLVAWGQDAHFFRPDLYIPGFLSVSRLPSENEIWTNDKPYVIYGYLWIESGHRLTILPGTQIHFHTRSGIWVYQEGSLIVNGEKDNEVVFQGDRLEDVYKDIPGQWDRIWINEGSNDVLFKHAIIKNGFVGIQAETLPFEGSPPVSNNKLILANTRIENMDGIGLLARNYNVQATNSIFSNTGSHCVAIQGGGNYSFVHTTIANYWPGSREETPSLLIHNHFTDHRGETEVRDLDSLYFGNSIIYGALDEELDLDMKDSGSFKYRFEHCVLKTKEDLDPIHFPNSFKNPSNVTVGGASEHPIFMDVDDQDFSLHEGSVARDTGSVDVTNFLSIDLSLDLKEVNRLSDKAPDLGALEYAE